MFENCLFIHLILIIAHGGTLYTTKQPNQISLQ